jgi:NAD(P)-dependent dehydrogenase (short-subunit alcohol dehydrogenase family)
MKSVVVTGCGRGIGRAVLERLASDGWAVVGLEIDSELAARAREAVDGATIVVGDAADKEIHDKLAAAAADVAPLGAWVNNASTLSGGGLLHQITSEAADRIFSVDLLGYFWGCAAALRTFVAQRTGGAIVNISSVHGRVGYSGHAVYDTAKGGIDALTRYVAVEYGPIGVRANAIAPGGVLTPGAQAVIEQTDDVQATLRSVALQNPLRKISDPPEIAAVASFLLSEQASFVTGQSLAVDGGLTAACMQFPLDPSLAEAYGLAPDGMPRQPA